MTVIDTHCHVFPSVRERLQDQLPTSVFKSFDEWLQKSSVPPGIGSLKSYWIKWVEGLEAKGLDIEGVASLQGRLHPNMYRVVEGLMISILAPRLMLQGTWPKLLESMNASGVDFSVVMAGNTNAPSEWVLELAKENKEIIPVVDLPLLPPSSPGDAYVQELERMIELGAMGFYIHPNVDNVPFDHPAYQAFFEVAKRHKKFIIMHTGLFHVPMYKNSLAPSLLEFEGYFKKFPEVKVCLAHMNRDKPEEAWQYMKRYEQLYADTSWQTSDTIRRAASTLGHDRILLGSDWPYLHLNLQSDALTVLKAALDEEKAADVCGQNAKNFLGL